MASTAHAPPPVNEEPQSQDDQDAPLDLGRLRQILVGEEQLRLTALEERVDAIGVRADDVAQVIPEAVELIDPADERLGIALSPIIETSIRHSATENPEPLAQALYPIIGPAIRKSITHAIRDLLETINHKVVHSFSPTAFRWRLEALRTRRPFEEIVLKHSLRFRVEQILLVHRETSLLLEHVTAPEVGSQDPEVISAMLGAIQDFVVDAFGSETTDGIAQIDFGQDVLHVAEGPSAILACVVRGFAPPVLRERIEETLESVHQEGARELADFQGDPAPFVSLRPRLEALLLCQAEAEEEQPAGAKRYIPHIVLTALLVLVSALFVRDARADKRWSLALADCAREPGLVILSAERDGAGGRVIGLRDPLAASPDPILRRRGLDPSEVEFSWTLFQSLDPQLLERRIQDHLAPPSGVSIELDQGRLIVTGEAPHAWVERLRRSSPLIAGVDSFDLSNLLDSDLERVRARISRIESREVRFTSGIDELGDEESSELVHQLVDLDLLARRADQHLEITLTGCISEAERRTTAVGWRRSSAVHKLVNQSLPGAFSIVEHAPLVEPSGCAVRLSVRILAEDEIR